MSLLLVVLPVALAADGPAFPEGVELHWRFAVSAVAVRVNGLGDAEYLSVAPVDLDWRCVAGPAGKTQAMTCADVDGEEVRLTWGAGRVLREVEPPGTWDYTRDRNAKRAAAALELAPATCTVGLEWRQAGRRLLMATAETAGNSVATLEHRVTAVEEGVATIRSEGRGALMVGSSNNVEARIDLAGSGESAWRCEDGVLVRRTFEVHPTAVAAGMTGTVGHRVTVELVP